MRQQIDSDAPIAVVCAIEAELMHIRATLGEGQEEWRTGRRYESTTVEGRPVVLVRCGIGMLSAAAATEALITHYSPSAILNYGCSGAHRPELLPGDLVIGRRTVAYDSWREDPDGGAQYAGMRYLRAGVQEKTWGIAASPHLLAAALRAQEALEGTYEPWPPGAGWPAGVPHRAPRAWTGTVASADRWNRSAATIRALVERHDSLCEDMESGAIALTCASHDVPFLAIRDISNNELLRTTGASWSAETEGQLGRRAAALTLATMRELGRVPSRGPIGGRSSGAEGGGTG